MTKTMHIAEFKAKFSEVTELLKEGFTIIVIKGKSGELVGYFGKEIIKEQPEERKLGFFRDSGIEVNKAVLEWSDAELEEMGL